MFRKAFRHGVGRASVVENDRRRDAELRAHGRRLTRELAPPLPLRVTTLCALLAEQRGTPIKLLEWELPANGPFGVLLSRQREDVIVHQAKATRAHQEHIILAALPFRTEKRAAAAPAAGCRATAP